MSQNISVDQMINEDKHKAELEEMMRQNLELTQEIHAMTKKIKGYITFQKFMTFFYMFLIIAPLILSFMYLTPMLDKLLSNYSEMLGPINELNGGNDFKTLPPAVQKVLEKQGQK